MIRKIDSNIFSLTILKVTTFSRIRQKNMTFDLEMHKKLLFFGLEMNKKYVIFGLEMKIKLYLCT